MELKDVKDKIKSALVFLKDKTKETLKLPYAKLYLILSIFVGIPFFVIVTFPFGTIIRNKLQEYANSDRTIQNIIINEIDFGLFSGFEMSGITINMANDKEVFIREIILDATLLPYQLLVSKKIDADIAINGFRLNSDFAKIKFDLSTNIDVALDEKQKIPSSGLINMMISRAEIKLSEFQLPDSMLGMKIQLDPIKITAVDFKSNISNKKLNIKTFKITGNDLRGSAKGNITISRRFMNSRIDLSISIDTKSKVISNNKLITENEMIKSQLDQMADPSGKLKFKLSGTLSRPRPSMTSSSRGSTPGRINRNERIEPEMETPDIIDRKSRKDKFKDKLKRKRPLDRIKPGTDRMRTLDRP